MAALPHRAPPSPGSWFWSPLDRRESMAALNDALLTARYDAQGWNPEDLARVEVLAQAQEQTYRARPDVSHPADSPRDRWTFLAQPLPRTFMMDQGTALTRYVLDDLMHPALAVARRGSPAGLQLLFERGCPTVLRFDGIGERWLAEVAARNDLAGGLKVILDATALDQRPAMVAAWLKGAVDGLHPERVREARPFLGDPVLAAPGDVASAMGDLLGVTQRSYTDSPVAPPPCPVRDERSSQEVPVRSAATLQALLELAPLERWTYRDGHEQARTRTLAGWMATVVREGNAWAIEPLKALGAPMPSMEKVTGWTATVIDGDTAKERGRRAAFALVEQHWLRASVPDVGVQRTRSRL